MKGRRIYLAHNSVPTTGSVKSADGNDGALTSSTIA